MTDQGEGTAAHVVVLEPLGPKFVARGAHQKSCTAAEVRPGSKTLGAAHPLSGISKHCTKGIHMMNSMIPRDQEQDRG